MAYVTPPQASVAAGEIGPALWGRADLAWQNSAAKELENFIPTPHGPAKFAGGTRFICETADSAKKTRLVPWRYSVDDAYMLMFGDQTIRFGREKGRIESPPGTPVELAAGDGVPWTEDDLAALRYAQSADVLYLVHPSYPVRELRRASHTSWTVPASAFVDGPYYPTNTDSTNTLTPGATSGSTTFTAVNNTFAATDVGRHLRFKDSGNKWYWVKITAYTNAKVVTGTIYKARSTNAGTLASTTASATWRLGLWSDTTGYPAAVALHQGRLAFLTLPSNSLPRCDLSCSTALDTFSPTDEDGSVNDDNAISEPIASGELNTPRDLHSRRELLVFTAGEEFRITSGSLTEPLTPTNVKVEPLTSHGAADVDAVKAFGQVMFVQRDGRTLRALGYEIASDGYTAKDQTVRSPDIGKAGRSDAEGGFKELAWCQSPHYQLYAVRNDGVMPALAYLPEQEVYAWARHRRGGSAAGACIIESCASIPYGGVDQLWLVTKRTIGGSTKRYVEILEEPLGIDDPIEDAFYVDAGLTLDNTGTVLGFGTLTPGTGADAVDTTGVTFTASVGGFTSGHVGQRILYRYLDLVNYRAGRHPRHKNLVWKTAAALITARNSATEIECTIEAAFPAATVAAAIAADDWRLTADSVSGLDHLEGETVKVWGDGAPQSDQVVASGAITLETPAATVHAGLFAGGTFEPIIADIGSRVGTRGGKKQRLTGVSLYLYRSLGGRVTVYDPEDETSEQHELVPYRTSADPLGQAPREFSGWTERIPVPAGWEDDPSLLIEQDIPGPLQVRAIAPVLEVAE